MRPLSIVLQAFGSYVEPQEIELELFAAQRIFLIWGATGAGKTTLFDAISFALFGESADGERDASSLRCDLAPPTLPTEVRFDFALGERRYSVERRPRQERPRLRGEGLTTEDPSATLYRVVDGERRVEASGARKVTAAVEEVLGFRADQFRQVVLLPQGRFARLLRAGSAERQQLLDALFDTRAYGRLEAVLKRESREAREALELLRERSETVLAEGGVSSTAELRTALEAMGPKIEATARALRDAEEASTRAAAALRDGERRAALEKKRAAVAGERERLLGEASAIASEREALARARRAAPLAEAIRVERERSAAAKAAAEALEEARAQLKTAEVSEAEAAQRVKATRQNEGERLRSLHWLSQLRQMLETTELLDPARRALASADGALRDKRKEQRAAESALEKAKLELVDVDARRGEAAEQAAGAGRIAADLARAREQTKQRARLAELEEATRLAEEAVAAAQATLREAEAREATTQETLAELERTLEEGRVAQLARALEEGRPCPVCGATEHPHPAVASHELPNDDDVARSRAALAAARREVSEAGEAARALKDELTQKKAELVTLSEVLGLFGRQSLETFHTRRKGLEDELAAAERATRDVAALDVRRAAVAEDVDGAERAAQRAAEALRGASAELERQRGLLEERERTVPAPLREGDVLRAQIAEVSAAVEKQAKAAAEAERVASAADERLHGARLRLRAAEKAAAEAQRSAREESEAFARRVADAGFADVEELCAVAREPAQVEAMQRRVEAHGAALMAVEERLGRLDAELEAATGDLQIDALREASLRAQRARDELLERASEARLRQEDARSRLLRIEELERKLEESEGRYARIGRLAEAANGKNPKRLTFQRFVQGALLDDVLLAASQRLRSMSGGRFYLQRGGARGGLELQVVDTLSNSERSPSSLSGGETFLASLALALGLADAVQAHSGGVRLDTIFVDEGFGGLDAESLDHAMAALIQLQRAGKQVGIISHVAELRERIDARLEVHADPRGSRVRVVLP